MFVVFVYSVIGAFIAGVSSARREKRILINSPYLELSVRACLPTFSCTCQQEYAHVCVGFLFLISEHAAPGLDEQLRKVVWSSIQLMRMTLMAGNPPA